MQVRDGGVFAEIDVLARPQTAVALADDEDGQLLVECADCCRRCRRRKRSWSDRAASLAVPRGLQPGDELGEEAHVVGLNPGQLGERRRVVAMVRQLMVRFGDADLIVTADARFAADHHGDDARQVGLERQGLQARTSAARARRNRPACPTAVRPPASGRRSLAGSARCRVRPRGSMSGIRRSCGDRRGRRSTSGAGCPRWRRRGCSGGSAPAGRRSPHPGSDRRCRTGARRRAADWSRAAAASWACAS